MVSLRGLPRFGNVLLLGYTRIRFNLTKGRLMTRTLLTGLAAAAVATPAAAHTGAHSQDVVTQIVHFFSSPVHSAGTLIAAAILVAGIVYLRRRKA